MNYMDIRLHYKNQMLRFLIHDQKCERKKNKKDE